MISLATGSLIAVGAVAYTLFGYLLGRTANSEYYDNTSTSGFWRTIRRRIFFPVSSDTWAKRSSVTLWRHSFNAEEYYAAEKNKENYCIFIALTWPITILPPMVVGVIVTAIRGIAQGTGILCRGIIDHKLGIPALWKMTTKRTTLRVREKAKILLTATIGQSIIGAPAWLWLMGWKLAALNIGLSWLVWRLGASRISQTSRASVHNFTEVIAQIKKSCDNELTPQEADLCSLRTATTATCKEIDARIKELTADIQQFRDEKNSDLAHLAQGYEILIKRMSTTLEKKRAEGEYVEIAINDIKKAKQVVSGALKMLQGHQFIDSIDPHGGTSEQARVLRDTVLVIQKCRQSVNTAYGVEVSCLQQDESIPIEDILRRVETGIKAEHDAYERSIAAADSDLQPVRAAITRVSN